MFTDTQTCMVSFKQFWAPNSLYNITSKNNALEFFVTDRDMVTGSDIGIVENVLIKITPGYYSASSLIAAINNLYKHIVFTYNDNTGRSSFQINTQSYPVVNTGRVLDRVGILTDTYSKLPTMLGYCPIKSFQERPSFYSTLFQRTGYFLDYSQINQIGYTLVTSTTCINLLLSNIYVMIDKFSHINRCSGYSIGQIFDVIRADTFTFFGNGFITHNGDFEIHLPRAVLNGEIGIKLMDEDGEEIDWNGIYWEITLGVRWALDTGAAGMETANIYGSHVPMYVQGTNRRF